MNTPVKSIGIFKVLLLSLLFCTAPALSAAESYSINYKHFVAVTNEKNYSRFKVGIAAKLLTKKAGIPRKEVRKLVKSFHVVAINYRTAGVDGKETIASGIIAYPKKMSEYDHFVSLQHGTIDLENAPSLKMFNFEIVLPLLRGNVIVMADYLGYGASQNPDRQHPYLHIKSTGTACADMIAASREYFDSKGIRETADSIMLAGYSQGGTATIATLLELERRGEGDKITSVHAGGGMYDIKASLNSMLKEGKYPYMQYVAFLIRGISYGEGLKPDYSQIFSKSAIDKGIVNAMETKPLKMWKECLGDDIKGALNPDMLNLNTFNGNKEAKDVYEALMKNSLVNGPAPRHHIFLYNSKTDECVPYANTESAAAHWKNSTVRILEAPTHITAMGEFSFKVFGFWDLIKKNDK